ncbi:glycoside hydrolase family 28 protein [Halenospora varia]|nr:glycoside hydrolase family 28 protein [Halenospora varia]
MTMNLLSLFTLVVNPHGPSKNGRACVVQALGNNKDDTPQILKAFAECNHGGTIVFPEGQKYWIATRLNPTIYDVTVEWKGIWVMSDNLAYWRNNSYPVAFQNHAAGIVFSGERIHINGFDTGGIHGNGNAWYNAEKAVTQPGRPMPFVWNNTAEVVVENFEIKDSPLWVFNIMNGTNIHFNHITANSTALSAPYGTNWVQNTDGFDTMDANNIRLTNMYYQGGDDCIAIKPRSYNIFVQNVTCHGGNGIAIGSLGQYLEDSSVVNVTISDVRVETYNNDMHNSAYIKTWVGALVPQSGYESAGQPRGGGWGVVKNILFSNFYVLGASSGPSINQNSGDNGSYTGTSLMTVSDITFRNWTGYVLGGTSQKTASITCSKTHPCSGITFEDVELRASVNGTVVGAKGTCSGVLPGGVSGMVGSGCT